MLQVKRKAIAKRHSCAYREKLKTVRAKFVYTCCVNFQKGSLIRSVDNRARLDQEEYLRNSTNVQHSLDLALCIEHPLRTMRLDSLRARSSLPIHTHFLIPLVYTPTVFSFLSAYHSQSKSVFSCQLSRDHCRLYDCESVEFLRRWLSSRENDCLDA